MGKQKITPKILVFPSAMQDAAQLQQMLNSRSAAPRWDGGSRRGEGLLLPWMETHGTLLPKTRALKHPDGCGIQEKRVQPIHGIQGGVKPLHARAKTKPRTKIPPASLQLWGLAGLAGGRHPSLLLWLSQPFPFSFPC